MKSKSYLFVAVLLLLLAFGLRVHRWAELGTQADEGVHIVLADRIVAGDVLFRDLFWNHVPGFDLLLAATFAAIGSGVLFSRFWSVGAAVLTVAGLLWASRQAVSSLARPARDPGTARLAGVLAALLFACAPLPVFWSRLSMLESLEAAWATLSIACILRGLKQPTRKWWFLAGAMSGLALLAKLSAMVPIAAIGLFLVIYWLAGNKKEITFPLDTPFTSEKASKWERCFLTTPARRWNLVEVGSLFAGGLALALSPLALVLLVQGSAGDFFHLLSGADRLAPWLGWPDKLVTLSGWATRSPFVPLALMGGLLALLSRRAPYLLLLTWTGAELAALLSLSEIQLGWSGTSHYALPTVAAASLLAGSGLAWGWHASAAKPRARIALAGALALLVAPTLPGLAQDLDHVLRASAYPMPGFGEEKAIGRALALVTPDRDPILVLGNSIFYHWANRPLANRYFHYPSYLPGSRLAAESEAELIATLGKPDVGAVLLSRLYTRRLPQTVLNALYEKWTPVAMFPYMYQHDVILFLPNPATAGTGAGLATFETGIRLHRLDADVLASTAVLARLDWSTSSALSAEYTVFTHLVGPDGALVAQHDSWPVNGFRPTTAWDPGQAIVDYHWLELPANSPRGAYELRVGLYEAPTGERLAVQGARGQDTTFVTIPLQLE